MSKTMKSGLIIGGVALTLIMIISYFVMSLSVQSEAVSLQEQIPAQKTAVESKLDAMNKTLKDFVGVTKAESEEFLKFQKIVAESKKGQTIGGMMTAIQEVYPNFDVKGFKALYPTIEAQRKEFKAEQDKFNDFVREYNSYIKNPFNSFFLDNSKYKKEDYFVVSSSASKKSMETGIDDSQVEF